MSERMELSKDDLEFFSRCDIEDDVKRDRWAPKSPCCDARMRKIEFGPEVCTECGREFEEEPINTVEVDRVLRKVRR